MSQDLEAAVAALPTLETVRIAVVGVGYVGLPVAAHLGKYFPVVAYDVDQHRIAELIKGFDRTHEFTKEDLDQAKHAQFTSDPSALNGKNFFIVTVPTPIDSANRPDLRPLRSASEAVGKALRRGSVVVYESTVYPGATEEVCIPVIERVSGLKLNSDFFAGYSPERINPADPNHQLPDVMKIVSGSTPAAVGLISEVYRRVVKAGVHVASSIRVAEAAKVIENVQRDVNIALVNELALLFKRMGLESREVFDAAATKWNFHVYQPGLVGGHCIGVDPFYLTHKAQSLGFHPEMILAGRRINDSMPNVVVQDIIKSMLQRKLRADDARVLVVGFTFKGNSPDVRNTKVSDLVDELRAFGHNVSVYDPVADPQEVEREYGIRLTGGLPDGPFEAVVLAVKHDIIANMPASTFRKLLVPGGLLYDVKSVLPLGESDVRL